MNSKYTKEMLDKLVRMHTSIAGVLRALGVRQSGGMHGHIKRRIKAYGLDTTHFTGQRSNCGPNHKGGCQKHTWQEILVLRRQGRRRDINQLRRAMLEYGFEYTCSKCKLKTVWQGKPLVLHVHHKNGNWMDNRPTNLEFACPNCHQQLDRNL